MPPPRPRLAYLKRVVDRHGAVRIYYARGGKPYIRLVAPEGSAAFLEAYEAAQAAKAIQWRLAQRPKRSRRSRTVRTGHGGDVAARRPS